MLNSQNFPIFFSSIPKFKVEDLVQFSNHINIFFLINYFYTQCNLLITKQNEKVNVADNEFTHQISPDDYLISINISVYMELKCIYFFPFLIIL